MSIRIGFVMDPIGSINIKKDSTFAMMLAAQRRAWQVWYLEVGDLFVLAGQAMARVRRVEVCDDLNGWFELRDEQVLPLASLDALMMRKDPPFDMEYIYATYILELAHQAGCLVVNHPRSLRDVNEKAFTASFPQCAPATP